MLVRVRPALRGMGAWRCRQRWRGGKRIGEQPRKEILAKGAASERGIGHGEKLAADSIVFAFDRYVGNLALVAFEDRQQVLVAAVDIVAELQRAGVIHKSGLIGQVNGNEGR